MRKAAVTGVIVLLVLGIASIAASQEPKQPPVINAPAGQAPSDAIVLFDGKNLNEFTAVDGKPAGWGVENGEIIVKSGGGVITKREFGDIQLHLEFATPLPAKGEGQGRGNSGVYFQAKYECQVLDSFKNETYADGMLGAIYQQYVPLVNACRPPGAWQTYDMIFRAPRFNAAGNKTRQATLTVILNGVLIQDHVTITRRPAFGNGRGAERPHFPAGSQQSCQIPQYLGEGVVTAVLR